ncbi:PhnD/SsuA/transferrin family substrate-binding protein [Sulfurimonas sp.]
MKKFIAILLLSIISISTLNAKPDLFISNAFYGEDLDSINYKDAKTAMNLWLQKTSKKLHTSSDLIFYDNFQTLKEDKDKHHKVDVLILSPYSYLQHLNYCKKNFTQGWLKSQKDGKPFYRFVLLKRKNDSINNKEIAIEYYQYHKISKLVVQKYAWNHHLDASYVAVGKMPKPVLDLFFKKCDMAIVSDKRWNLMKELNPQLAQQLELVDTTPRIFPDMISLFANSMSKKQRNVYFQALNDLKTTPSGKQLMRLFKFNALVRISNNQFISLEKFYKEYLRLKALHEK